VKEIIGDLWDFHAQGHYICITTNGAIRRDGACVMGRGIAKQVAQKFPGFPIEVGNHIKRSGNTPGIFQEHRLISFPVKHHWSEVADLELIERSARMLQMGIRTAEIGHVYLPRPGCGNGHLQWSEVWPVVASILDDRFTVVEIAP